MQRLSVAAFAAVVLLGAVAARAQQPPADASAADAKIRKLLTAMQDGFNQADAKAVAACWTPGGDFVSHAGEHAEGRGAIEKGLQQALSGGKKRTLDLRVLSLRVVNDNLALAEVLAEVKPQVAPQSGVPVFSMVLVRNEGQWLIESARETVVSAPPQASQLKKLQWLLGDWAEATSDRSGVVLRSSCQLAENGSFMVRRFKIEGKEGIARAGTEVIGWDPKGGRVRSWVFDSTGGFGESIWVQDGSRWLLKYTGTLPDGGEVLATNVIEIVDADTVVIQAKDRAVNGQPQPDTPAVTLKRQPPPVDNGRDAPKAAPSPAAPSSTPAPVAPSAGR